MREILTIAERSADYGAFGLLIFGACLFAGTLSFIPRHLFSVLGGFLFGWSCLPVVILATLGSTAAGCAVSRYLFRDRLRRAFGPRKEAILAAVDEEGLRVVFLLALAGPIPHAPLMIIFGLTRIPLIKLVIAASLAHLPLSVLYVGLGAVGGSAAQAPSAFRIALLTLTILISAFIVTSVVRRTKVILNRQ